MDIFANHKPLRNLLRKLTTVESLRVVWAYCRNLEDNKSFDEDIEVIEEYKQRDHLQKTRSLSFWDLELLTTELVIYSEAKEPDRLLTLRKANIFARAINKLKDFDSYVSTSFVDSTNVLRYLSRLGHKQFPWQHKVNTSVFARHKKIFGNVDVAPLVLASTGLTTEQIYKIGILFVGVYQDNFGIKLPVLIEVPGIVQADIEKFLNLFAVEYNSLQKVLKSEQQLNINYSYSFSTYRKSPLIKFIFGADVFVVCPMPVLLFKQLFDRIYYEICSGRGLDQAFGNSFQNYIGDVLKTLDSKKTIVIPESKYRDGKDEKDSIDWVVKDVSGLLFVECKTKRLTMGSKFDFTSAEQLDADLGKMADFIVQSYKTLIDYNNSLYASIKPNEGLQVFPMVVTLEDWCIFGDYLFNKLKDLVIQKLKLEAIPIGMINSNPYSVCCAAEMEILVQVLKNVPIYEFMHRKNIGDEYPKWTMMSYMQKVYPNEIKKVTPLFPDELTKMLSI